MDKYYISHESDFFNVFIKNIMDNSEFNQPIYRGHSDSKFELMSNFHREGYKIINKMNLNLTREFIDDQTIASYEQLLLQNFLQTLDDCDYELSELSFKTGMYNHKTYSRHFFDFETDRFDEMPKVNVHPKKELIVLYMLAQHHGIPTSFLDWTKSYLIALYFALLGNDKSNFCVWSLDIERSFFGDTVDNLDNSNINPKLLEGGLLRVVNPPYHLSPNLRAQRGMFTYIEHKPSNDLKAVHDLEKRIDCEDNLVKYTFSTSLKDFILNYLKINNIHHGTVFPGLDNAVTHFKKIANQSSWGGDLFKPE